MPPRDSQDEQARIDRVIEDRIARGEPDEQRELRLVQAIRAGDHGAWSGLIDLYQDRIYATCVRMLGDQDRAADQAHEAVIKVMEGIRTYDGRARLSTWIIRVTMNACLTHLRSEKYRRHASLDAMRAARSGSAGGPVVGRVGFEPEGGEPDVHSRVQSSDQQTRLISALLELSPEHRAVLVLRDGRGMDYEQIGDVLGIAVGTVKSRLFRARAALREALGGRIPDAHHKSQHRDADEGSNE